MHQSRLLHLCLPLFLGASTLTGCYKAEFSGLACQSSQECGDLICVDGACVDPDDSPHTSTTASTNDTVTTTTSESGSDSDSTGGSTGEVELFQGTNGCCNKLDVLLVIDQSLLMELQCFEDTFMSSIVSQYNTVYGMLSENIDSFHIGFTTASIAPGNPKECKEIGSLLRGREGDSCYSDNLHNKPYLTSEDQPNLTTFLDSILCLLRVGTETDLSDEELEEQDDARPIEALLDALAETANATGGCNEGFSRDGVPLLIVLMTNSDQAGYLPANDGEEPIDWWRTTHAQKDFDAAEGQKRIGIIMISAPDTYVDPKICTVDPDQSRLPAFYSLFDQDLKRRYDICAMKPDGWLIGEKCQSAADDKLDDFSDFFMPALDDLTCDVCAP